MKTEILVLERGRVMRRILVFLATLAAAAVAAGAAFAGPGINMVVEEGGGGSYGHPRIYIINYDVYEPGYGWRHWSCEYLDFGNGLVIQNRCW